ncbi:GAF domain-containing sensor histidine kinase [Alteromonas pelagimontana]|uniref:histidine kinase n=1 Tax=Alteromonas pelagimontana TaxID=1858656 RepID=A0A6M4MCY4_9ALTE|nr:GAF domain-containing sensor histidine kinase [Alteromonas pelagimontana]QJR80983.1 GAF domain-containing sensor histidine kinase [Alteromonas pelagimontana]
MTLSIQSAIRSVQSLDAVPTIMQMIAEATGLRFVCVAKVTASSWTACAVLDKVNFNLHPGDELEVQTTLCDEVRSLNQPIVIENVNQDKTFCKHHTPKTYGFKSYFSFPIYGPDGEFFGTLCGLDPMPAELKTPELYNTLSLFAELISRQLKTEKRLSEAEAALQDEQDMAKLREQYIGVLGHDLRTPLSSISMGLDVLSDMQLPKADPILIRMNRSVQRISRLITDVMDFTHSKMGSGIPLNLIESDDLASVLHHSIAELVNLYQPPFLTTDIDIQGTIKCDPARIGQLLSNLLINALVHGDTQKPIAVSANYFNGQLTVKVANEGKAIAAATLSRLFEPFWREPSKNPKKGLGLGLFIASEIAKAHNGKLEAHSDANSTSFTFSATL